MLRRKPKAPVDPLAHVDPALAPPRYAAAVADAVAIRARWQAVVAGLRDGPTKDRMAELGERVDAGVLAVWDTVVRAAEVERVADGLEADRVTADYKAAKRDPATDPALVEALRARFESTQRLLNATDGVGDQLRLLDARLGAAVARGAEVALVASPDTTASLGAELDGVVGELGALRDTLSTLS
jgi:hypothetical protein